MTVPIEYSRASEQFEAFLVDARDRAGLSTTHQAFTMTQGVLQAFRRRLSVQDALRFADALPVGLRALFVVDWNVSDAPAAFGDRASMTKEVQSLRSEHNFAPPTAIADVATTLWKHIDVNRLEEVLADLPGGAEDFWKAEIMEPPGKQ